MMLMKVESQVVIECKNNCLESQELYIDVNSFMEVAENIVANALRFAKDNIRVSIQKNRNDLELIVIDDGKGFSEQDIIKACKPYYHEDLDNSEEHYGLGLYICKIICEKHGGTIVLSNTESGGARVQATFNISI